MQSAKQLTRIGLLYLEEAILDVLFEARETASNPSLRAVDIRRKIGVYREWSKDGWFVGSILRKLASEARVEQMEAKGPWKLTDAEYEKKRVG